MYSEKVMDYFTHPRHVGINGDAYGAHGAGTDACQGATGIFTMIGDAIITKNCPFKTFDRENATTISSMATELGTLMKGLPLPKNDYAANEGDTP